VSDRLEEFRRQRALLREHLAWLDRQIGGLEGSPDRPAYSEPPPLAPAVPEGEPAAPTPAQAQVWAQDAEAILAEYRQPPVSLQKQAKFGCLVYFGVALAVLAAFVVIVYALAKRTHGH